MTWPRRDCSSSSALAMPWTFFKAFTLSWVNSIYGRTKKPATAGRSNEIWLSPIGVKAMPCIGMKAQRMALFGAWQIVMAGPQCETSAWHSHNALCPHHSALLHKFSPSLCPRKMMQCLARPWRETCKWVDEPKGLRF